MKHFITTFLLCIPMSFLGAQSNRYFDFRSTQPEVGMTCVLEIHFIFDKAIYFPEFQPIIDSLADFIKTHRLVVEVGNHRDSRGSNEFSIDITRGRARAIVDSLIARGVPKENLVAKNYGESMPRTLEKDYVGYSSGYIFQKGIFLNDEYIYSLKDDTEMGQKKFEDAHSLNRRTEIKILSISN